MTLERVLGHRQRHLPLGHVGAGGQEVEIPSRRILEGRL